MKEDFEKMKEPIGDKKEKQEKKFAKVEMPAHLVLTEKERQEEMKRRREDPHWFREQP